MTEPKKITRKEALKRIGGFALGSTLITPAMVSGQEPKAGFPHVRSKRSNRRPNILWITGEGVPLRVLGCYGGRLIPTPNIDRIANEGMLFTNSFTTNALCAPSRATLLTGKYDHLNGMLTNPGYHTAGEKPTRFDPAQETFPKIMRRHGYQTGVAGKWHLIANPGKVGFDYFVFKRGAGGPYYNPKGFLQNPSLGSEVIQPRTYPGYITDTFTDLAIQGMEQLKEPFLMMVQYFNDHRPFGPPHKYRDLFAHQRIPEPGTFWDDYANRSAAAKEAHMRVADMPDYNPPKDMTERQKRQWNYQKLMQHFLGTLKAQDDNIGRLLDYLDRKGLADNTIVVYTTDHGFFLGEHGWFDKRFMYEEAIRVPWMIRYPGRVKPGSVCDAWGINIDNAPTALDLVNLPIPADMQGKSLVPLMEGGRPSDWRTSYYYHYYEFGSPHWVLPNYGIRTERYKLISYYTINEWELFDLEKDPDEMESLLEMGGYKIHPGYEKVVHDHVQQLKQLRHQYADNTGRPVRFWPTRSYD